MRYASRELIEPESQIELEKKKSQLNYEVKSMGSKSNFSGDQEYPFSENAYPSVGRASFID